MRLSSPIVIGRKAVFIPHNGFSCSLSADDVFAECLSEGDSSEEAARRAGFAPGTGRYHAKRLSTKLGAGA